MRRQKIYHSEYSLDGYKCNFFFEKTNTKGYYQLNYKNGVRENPKLISPFMPELVIISAEEWNATHEELQKHTTQSKDGKKSKHGSMLLAGIMFFGTCGRIK